MSRHIFEYKGKNPEDRKGLFTPPNSYLTDAKRNAYYGLE